MHDLVQVPYVILTPAAQIGDDQPRSAQNQELQGVSNFVDGSGAYSLNVFGNGCGRRQEDGRRMESGR